MKDGEILQKFQNAVKLAVAAVSPGLPIKFVDISLDIPDDQKYLEIVKITNNVPNVTWGNDKWKMGMFRLILHWPKDGSGPYEPMNKIEALADCFDKGTLLGDLQIADVPNIMSTVDGGHEILYPASIRYSHFVP